MKDGQFDMKALEHVREYANHLKAYHSSRNSMYDVMEDMFLMNWDEEKTVKRKMKNTKLTKSPDARNTLLGVIRLMIASDPTFSMPFDKNSADAEMVSENIENMADTIWNAAGRVRGDPIHYDIVRSALLFSEIHVNVTSTADQLKATEGASKAVRVMAEDAAKRTPYLFDASDPRKGYPEIDRMGLVAFYREEEMIAGSIKDQFGEDAERPLKDRSRWDKVTLCDFYDRAERHVWIKGEDPPIIQEEHGLPSIPWVVTTVEGSKLFDESEYRTQPFLYTLWKSGLWNRQNLALTVLYTMIFGIGSNPIFVEKIGQQGGRSNIDMSRPGGVIEVPFGNDFYPLLSKGVIDPSILQGLEIADQKITESTIYSQTLGEPLGANAPFSMVALLNQAGRLPLTVPQRKGGWCIADAMKIALMWMKEPGQSRKANYQGEAVELNPSEIPSVFELEAKLDINLPQDDLQNANVANQMTQGDDPIVSMRWARENVLNIGQSEKMQEEIWTEKASTLFFMRYFQDQMALARQQMGLPPTEEAGAPAVQPGQNGGQPGLQGLPPEMEQMGGQPIEPMPGQPGPREGMI